MLSVDESPIPGPVMRPGELAEGVSAGSDIALPGHRVSAEPSWAYALRVGAVWVLVGTLAVLLARVTGIALPELRFLIPYLSWPLMTPLVAALAHRVSLAGRRGRLIHLGLALLVAPLHGLTFRLLLAALGRGFSPWPSTPSAIVVTLTVELVLYFSTAWPIAAALALRRAQESDLARARAEAREAGDELDAVLGQLGPKQLDLLLGRARVAIDDFPANAEEALSALATYLRAGLGAVEETAWTLERELHAAAAYLTFEQACSGRRFELLIEPPNPPGASPVRRYSLVSALSTLVESAPGPLRLRLRRCDGGCTLDALDPATQRTLAALEVPT